MRISTPLRWLMIALVLLAGEAKAGYYEGSTSNFSFGFNPSGCTNNTSSISNIQIRLLSHTQAYIKFDVNFNVSVGTGKFTFSSYGNIVNGGYVQ